MNISNNTESISPIIFKTISTGACVILCNRNFHLKAYKLFDLFSNILSYAFVSSCLEGVLILSKRAIGVQPSSKKQSEEQSLKHSFTAVTVLRSIAWKIISSFEASLNKCDDVFSSYCGIRPMRKTNELDLGTIELIRSIFIKTILQEALSLITTNLVGRITIASKINATPNLMFSLMSINLSIPIMIAMQLLMGISMEYAIYQSNKQQAVLNYFCVIHQESYKEEIEKINVQNQEVIKTKAEIDEIKTKYPDGQITKEDDEQIKLLADKIIGCELQIQKLKKSVTSAISDFVIQHRLINISNNMRSNIESDQNKLVSVDSAKQQAIQKKYDMIKTCLIQNDVTSITTAFWQHLIHDKQKLVETKQLLAQQLGFANTN